MKIDKRISNYSKEDALLIILLAFSLLLSLSAYRGVGVGDSGEYINAAYDLCHGRIPITENFYSNRIGTVAPFTFAMYFWRWNSLQLTYVSAFIFLLLLLVVYKTVSYYSKTTALCTVALLGVSRPMVDCSAAVMGDMTITLLANTPVLIYCVFISRNRLNALSEGRIMGFIAGIVFVLAALTKESIAFFLPLLCWLAYRDRKSVARYFWAWLFGVGFFCGLAIGIWYWYQTGDFFFRFNEVDAGCSQSDCNYSYAPVSLILKRITYQPFIFLIEDYRFGILFLLSLLNLLSVTDSKVKHFFKIYLLGTLGLWWIGPQGLPWNPVALVHRLWLPIMVPLAINAAIFLKDVANSQIPVTEKKKLAMATIIFMLLAFASLVQLKASYQAVNQTEFFMWFGAIYFIIGLLVMVNLWAPEKWLIKKILFPLTFLMLLGFQGYSASRWLLEELHFIRPFYIMNVASDFNGEKEAVQYVETLKPAMVLTDNNLSRKYHIYDDFKQDYKFKDWNTVKADSLHAGAYLLINKNRLEQTRRNLPETLIYTNPNPANDLTQIPEYVVNPLKFGFILIRNTQSHEIWCKE